MKIHEKNIESPSSLFSNFQLRFHWVRLFYLWRNCN